MKKQYTTPKCISVNLGSLDSILIDVSAAGDEVVDELENFDNENSGTAEGNGTDLVKRQNLWERYWY